MAGGLPIVVGSSEAWPEYGAQEARALNTGWILDQRFDGAGGFLSNCSATSSGLRFISTGDATPFYVTGRAIKVIQAAGTAVATVGLSSASGGITTVYLSALSTAPNMSTALSTGAITSVAASPIFPQSTANNTFGAATVIATTAGPLSIYLPDGTASNPSLVWYQDPGGLFNGFYRPSQNALAYTAGLTEVIRFDAQQALVTIAAATNLKIGTTPGSSGVIRVTNSDKVLVGRTSTGGDDVLIPMQFSSTTLSADVQSSGNSTNFTTLITKTLGTGTWAINAGVVVGTSVGGVPAFATARIFDGTNTFASAAGWLTGATGIETPLNVSAVVSHTTALAYSLQLATGSTAFKAHAKTIDATSSPAATWWTAVKIG